MFNYTSCCSPPASMSKAVLVLQLPSFMFPQTRRFLKCVPRSSDCRSGRCEGRIAGLWGMNGRLLWYFYAIWFLHFGWINRIKAYVANPVYNVRSKTSNSKDVTASLQHRFSMQQRLDVSSAVSGLMDRWMNRFINRSMEILWMDEAEGKRRSEWWTTGCGMYFCFVQTAVSFQTLVFWALLRRTIIR